MTARYRFTVRFRVDPEGLGADPDTFETSVTREADPPGEAGWLFFRDNLWRGDLTDGAPFRETVAGAFAPAVVGVEFRAFEADGDYVDDLRAAVEADLDAFRAESAREALHKYLGSRLERVDD